MSLAKENAGGSCTSSGRKVILIPFLSTIDREELLDEVDEDSALEETEVDEDDALEDNRTWFRGGADKAVGYRDGADGIGEGTMGDIEVVSDVMPIWAGAVMGT
jgi:hypothetical protein